MTTSSHRVLLADDDASVRNAYRGILGGFPDFELVAEARDGAEAIEAYAVFQPDLVLMDLQMPRVSGIDATGQICAEWPGACIVALTTFGAREHIVAALRAGAAGYLLKDVTAEALAVSMHQALLGEMPLSSSIRRELVSSLFDPDETPDPSVEEIIGLTAREEQLLFLLAKGLTNSQLADEMGIAEGSVKQYLSHIGDKLQVRSRTQIIIKAVQLDLIDPRQMDLI